MEGKGGAVDWSVGKLLAIILVVILLVVVVLGWNSVTVPLFERVKGMFSEVLLMFGGGDKGGGGVECYSEDGIFVDGVGSGKMTYCRGYCEIRMDGKDYFEFGDLKSNRFKYDVKSGVMNNGGVEDDGKWYSFDQRFVGLDVGEVEIARQLYNLYKQVYKVYFENHKNAESLSLWVDFSKDHVQIAIKSRYSLLLTSS